MYWIMITSEFLGGAWEPKDKDGECRQSQESSYHYKEKFFELIFWLLFLF